MGPIGCVEKSARIHHYSLRNNPEERISHLLRCGSLKSRREVINLLLFVLIFTGNNHTLEVWILPTPFVSFRYWLIGSFEGRGPTQGNTSGQEGWHTFSVPPS